MGALGAAVERWLKWRTQQLEELTFFGMRSKISKLMFYMTCLGLAKFTLNLAEE